MTLPGIRWLGMGLIFISLLPLSNSAQHYSSRLAFVEDSVARLATVVQQQPVARLDSQEVQSLVEYTDENGTSHQALTNISSYPAPFAIGEQVDILVDKNDPVNIRVDSFAGTWLEVTFYLIPGLLALTGGLVMLQRSRKR
ncbi:DUF3592 domain-containing protein [Granulosicoccus antarcticus]|uniref:Uncharacterized protein n=1 Tax=Granulosicoccus antarcticus IMCC3135 TaxID=1192854 RepID=A0A2Z2NS19_9GAMM|nr:DUF3592 domain-containing protein [Granulosicoccus antarcticus]ASJ71530.1 hypothetical protein IMCC3135_07120 [Granulosicoccus antarcticus IMCC3135]